MPKAPAKSCAHVGCARLVTDGTNRCADHKVKPGSFADRNRGSRHERGYGAAWDKLRLEILKRDGGVCQTCLRSGRVTPAGIVDHITPKAEGGTDDPVNLEAICADCHRAKTQAEAGKGGRKSRGVDRLWTGPQTNFHGDWKLPPLGLKQGK